MREGGREGGREGLLTYLLEQGLGKVDLVGDGATVDLHFEDVRLLLAELELLDLGVGDDSDHVGVVLDALEFLVHLGRREGREGGREGGRAG